MFKRKRIEKVQKIIANHPLDQKDIKYLEHELWKARITAGGFLWSIRNRKWKSDCYFLDELRESLQLEMKFFHLSPEEEDRLLRLLKLL